MKVSASILSCDFSNLENEFKKINGLVDFIHLDVMDGHFVPNISFGPDIIDSIRKLSDVPFESHLMISNPLKYIKRFQSSDIIIFHLECDNNPEEVISEIKKMNKKVGISIKPKTDVKNLDKFLEYIDLVLIMTVEPGFGGQSFMQDQVEKIKYLKNKIDIEVDGGINDKSSRICEEAGASICVAGTYIFKSDNVLESVKKLRGF